MITLVTDAQSLDFHSEKHSNINFHWEDYFLPKEQKKIRKWLTIVSIATQNVLGKYPFEIHFYLYKRPHSKEPVPWAFTERHKNQGVHFYVDPSFSCASFLQDWTAPHEISHLSIPFLGKSNSWFSEGYATFMQVQIMKEIGIYTPEKAQEKYMKKFRKMNPHFENEQTFIQIANQLKEQNKYAPFYWGSVNYFYSLNQSLQSTDSTTLMDVIKQYQNCCRMEDATMQELIQSIDQLSYSEKASQLLYQYQNLPARKVLNHIK